MTKSNFLNFYILLTISIIVVIFISSNLKDSKNEEHIAGLRDKYGVYTIDIPEEISFAQEKVPLNRIDVRERFDRELLVNTYWHSNTFLLIKRANKWFPVIENILKENGIPEDFKYLALIESGLENVSSPAGAKGFWQILKETGKMYGLEINDEIDERYNVEKSTYAACRYLKNSYEKFQSWTLAAASYNCGPSGLEKQMDRQNGNNYYDLNLNSETARYVYRILAAKHILNNSKEFGFNFRDKDLYIYIPDSIVKLDSSVTDFALYASKFDITYNTLKILNPWLRTNTLSNPLKKVYEIKIPLVRDLDYEKTLELIEKNQ